MKGGNRARSNALAVAALFALGGSATMASAQGTKVEDGALVGPNGMTLYTFDKDTAGSGKSACNGPCAQNWPPLMASSGSANGDWTIITRDDGGKQWAYKGRPVYYWAKDTKPGDRTGAGVGGVWQVAKP